MGEYCLFLMKNTELYPVYRSYVRMIKMSFLLFLPLSAGMAYLTWFSCERPGVTALVLFVCMAFFVIGSLLKNCFLKCPYCGKHTVTIRAEACSVVSVAWSMAPLRPIVATAERTCERIWPVSPTCLSRGYLCRFPRKSFQPCGMKHSERSFFHVCSQDSNGSARFVYCGFSLFCRVELWPTCGERKRSGAGG